MFPMCFSTAPSVTTSSRAICGVGAALGHQPEHLALARRSARASGSSRRRRTNSCATTCGSSTVPPRATRSQRVEELVDVRDPVLEQVADRARPVGQQVVGVGDLDVLGEHQHRRAGHRRRASTAARSPSSVCERRHPHVDDRHVGPVLRDRGHQRRPVADRGHHLVPVSSSSRTRPSRSSTESSATTTRTAAPRVIVGRPARRADHVSVPPAARTRSASPASPCPLATCAPPAPSSTI